MKQTITIPNKLYFRIGEVADLLSVKPYVLRYWETEFPDIKPAKSKSGQRLYKRRDVEVLVHIKDLLYAERFTINGARKRLKELMREHRASEPGPQMPLGLEGEDGGRQVPSRESLLPPKQETRPAQAYDNRKTLLKIKKDLESLVQLLKS